MKTVSLFIDEYWLYWMLVEHVAMAKSYYLHGLYWMLVGHSATARELLHWLHWMLGEHSAMVRELLSVLVIFYSSGTFRNS